MKKIKRMNALIARRKALEQRQQLLQSAIAGDWKAMKERWKPFNIVKDIFSYVKHIAVK